MNQIVKYLLVTLILVAGITTRGNANGPSISCDAPVYDYGTCTNTEDILHSFTITNKGREPLVISQVRTGCGCTRADLDRSTIPPGGTASLSARLTLRGYSGIKRTSIYLHTNDPDNPIFMCQFNGTAIAIPVIAPAGHNDVAPGSPNQSHVVTIQELNVYPTKLVLQESVTNKLTETRYIILQTQNNQAFKVKTVEVIPPTIPVTVQSIKPFWVRLKVGPTHPSKAINGTVIRVHTDLPKQPTIDIPIKVTGS